jgi:DNA-binding winged helix-turn-helix (wHTH) protein
MSGREQILRDEIWDLGNDCLFWPDQYKVFKAEQGVLDLTPLKRDLLRCLTQHSGTLVAYETLKAEAWKNPGASREAIQKGVSRLLEKLRPFAGSFCASIEGKSGRGYEVPEVSRLSKTMANEFLKNHQPTLRTPEVAEMTSEAGYASESQQSDASSPYLSPTGARALRAQELVSMFISEARIAGQIANETGSEAIYLDDVYTHRAKVESAVLQIVARYFEHPPQEGKWISISGDAGHGKTSLLWFLTGELRKNGFFVVAIQAQQLPDKPIEWLAQLCSRSTGRSVVIIDTLDLLVGIDDGELARNLNELRTEKGLVITTSRRQELQKLAQHIRSDVDIDLPKYDPPEAEQAVRSYIDAYYRGWSDDHRAGHFDRVWRVIDQRRLAQELSLEPLILRMIFEAYFPEPVPPDINTQKVYDQFWQRNVIADRTVKYSDDPLFRDEVCRSVADQIYFTSPQQVEHLPTEAVLNACSNIGKSRSASLIEDLVSSGVFRWWQGRAGVGFFHQSFLEYAAAKHILSLDPNTRSSRVNRLLMDTLEANLFRVAVLKQLMIQSSIENKALLRHILDELRASDTPLGARLAVEVLGKAALDPPLEAAIFDWNVASPGVFRPVLTDLVRGYPVSKIPTALELLRTQLAAARQGEIFFVCERFFAPIASKQTLDFLRYAIDSGSVKAQEVRGGLKSAIIATLRAGELEALEVLKDIFPELSLGVVAGTLTEIADAITVTNAGAISGFLQFVFHRLAPDDDKEARYALTVALRALRRAAPAECLNLANQLREENWAQANLNTAVLLAKVLGVTGPSLTEIHTAIQRLSDTDHKKRFAATELLYEAAQSDDDILEMLLNEGSTKSNIDSVKAIYRVASGSHDTRSLRAVIDRWVLPDRGAGNPYREVLQKIAQADPEGAKEWLIRRLAAAGSESHKRQTFVGFQVLAESVPTALTGADVRTLFEFAFADRTLGHEVKRVFSGMFGSIAAVNVHLADQIADQIFASGDRDYINALLNSLSRSHAPDLILSMLERVLQRVQKKRDPAALGIFLTALRDSDIEVRRRILKRLATPDGKISVRTLNNATAVSAVLRLVKSSAEPDPVAALDLALACPLLDKGNTAMLSAALENISLYTAREDDLRAILTRILDISEFYQWRIRNSLHRTMERLDRKLPHRTAVLAVVKKISTHHPWDERALEDLVRAAKNMPSWTLNDSQRLLQQRLPPTIQAILAS